METIAKCCACNRLCCKQNLKKRIPDNQLPSFLTSPLNRQDIFYSGSVLALPEYQKEFMRKMKEPARNPQLDLNSAIEYRLSTINVIQDKFQVSKKKGECIICMQTFRNTLALLITFKIKNFCNHVIFDRLLRIWIIYSLYVYNWYLMLFS